jgi:hypothetical protein
VITRRLLKKADDLGEAFLTLAASYESAFHADDERHDSEAGGARRHHPCITRNVLPHYARTRLCAFPIVTKAGLLQHSKQLIICKLSCRGGHCGGPRRLAIVAICRSDFVISCLIGLTDEIGVAVDSGYLDSNGLVLLTVRRSINRIVRKIFPGDRCPTYVDVSVVTNRPNVLRRQ